MPLRNQDVHFMPLFDRDRGGYCCYFKSDFLRSVFKSDFLRSVVAAQAPALSIPFWSKIESVCRNRVQRRIAK